MKDKLESIMARLDGPCSEEDGDDGPQSGSEQERWAKLFEYVVPLILS